MKFLPANLRQPCWGLASLMIILVMGAGAATPASLDDPVAGQRLAAELRVLQPPTNSEFLGTLRISRPKTPDQNLPLRLQIMVRPAGGWKTIYEARLPVGGTETLTITHTPGQPATYELQRGDAVEATVETNMTASFAGSDFWLVDLGMGFLHWPGQSVVAKEMRKGFGCSVLASRPAETTRYSRVLSWIDQEQGGLIMAEGYDARGKLLKEFEVKSVKKVAGQYQVSEMEMRNRQDKTSTRLQFKFDKD